MKPSLAAQYMSRTTSQEAPEGAVAQVTVIAFADGTVYVGGPAIGHSRGIDDETTQAALLQIGLQLQGWDVDVTRPSTGESNPAVELTGIQHPDVTLVGTVEAALA